MTEQQARSRAKPKVPVRPVTGDVYPVKAAHRVLAQLEAAQGGRDTPLEYFVLVWQGRIWWREIRRLRDSSPTPYFERSVPRRPPISGHILSLVTCSPSAAVMTAASFQ